MKNPTSLFLDGKPLRLGKRLGKGGEGEVFEIAGSAGHAVKIYFKPDHLREAKVTAMVASGLGLKSNLIAFPIGIVRDRSGAFVGFSMHAVKGHTSLHDLYSPGSRKVHFPKADYRFTVRSASNIARAVAKVHELGAVIGDINHSGILVSGQAVAALIDADSFQFGRDHLCRVGVAEYTPPELQGKRLDNTFRTPGHDAFGLAVVIFQLLFMGRHPYMGRYQAVGEMPIEKAITEHRFAYSTSRKVGMLPPPGACTLTDFAKPVQDAFEAAFSPSPETRPTAGDWVKTLERLEGSLSKCSSNSMHYYPSAASRCMWCRMEQQIGILLFLPPFDVPHTPQFVDPGAAGFNLGAVWARIEAIQIPAANSLTPPYPSPSVKPSAEAMAYKRTQSSGRVIGFLALLVAAGVLYAIPAAWLVYLPLALFGLGRVSGSDSDSGGKFPSRHKSAEQNLHRAVEDWRSRIGTTEIEQLVESLRDARDALQDLPQEEKRLIAEHEANRRDVQLHDHLERFSIQRADIRGVGPAKLAALASYGIDTAADLIMARILAVPGFGESSARPLLLWRDKVAARFVFQPQPTTAELKEVDRLKQSCADKAAHYRSLLAKGPTDLTNARSSMLVRAKAPDIAINKAYEAREIALADLRFLGLQVPVVAPPPKQVQVLKPTPPAAKPLPVPPVRTRTSSTAISCPTCGGRMVKRQARRGRNPGGYFWGCAAFPRCRGTRSI